MSGVLERLNEVRERMRSLGRELDGTNRIFDADEVNRKVRARLEHAELEARSGRSTSSQPSS